MSERGGEKEEDHSPSLGRSFKPCLNIIAIWQKLVVRPLLTHLPPTKVVSVILLGGCGSKKDAEASDTACREKASI